MGRDGRENHLAPPQNGLDRNSINLESLSYNIGCGFCLYTHTFSWPARRSEGFTIARRAGRMRSGRMFGSTGRGLSSHARLRPENERHE